MRYLIVLVLAVGCAGCTAAQWEKVEEKAGKVAEIAGTAVTVDVPFDNSDEHNVTISGHIVTTAAGTLQFQWAQRSSGAVATIVRAGSWMKLSVSG